MDFPLLSLLLALPVAGAILVALLPRERTELVKGVAFATCVAALVLSLPLYFNFQPGVTGFQFEEVTDWIPGLNISYHVGVDGISLFLVLLTTLLSAVAVLSSWTAITEQVKEYMALMLLMETAMLGVFVSLDLFLFYVFWEASLIPMALLIGRWGGTRRIYAAIKFFLFTMAGSALMLVATIVLYLWGGGTSDLPKLLSSQIPAWLQVWLFAAFALAFAVKVPLFPLHTWLPAAHVEAPTAGSIILAGVLLKMGAYGYLRFALPLFPDAVPLFAPWLSILALIGIVYGALVALAQEDVKSLVAYSSVAHMGFIVLGTFALTPQAVSGAVLQMVNHGLSTGGLFLLVGVLYERRHTRLLKDYGGIWVKAPIFGSFFIITALSSVGLPGMNGFVGEFTILLGTFRVNVVYAAIATFGIVLAAWYLLVAVRRLLFGPLNPANTDLSDMNAREIAVMLPLVVFFFVIGLFPNLFFQKINPAVETMTSQVTQTRAVAEMSNE
ncbi:MAG: NADH-quinone oxidoreductase subunit M [Anaerolineales bacterium]|nr:MAG: NADH-quinone oxidoreductase subunit M [Anaerolineales bacterium]